MSRDSSPEEKLLNLIKRRKDKAPASGSTSAPAPESILSSQKKTQPAFPSLLNLDNMLRLETVRKINITLFSMIVAVISYLLIDILFLHPAELVPTKQQYVRPAKRLVEPESQPYEYYSKDLERDIFKPIAREREIKASSEIPTEELMANLSLLGIVSGENPQAIIEDKAKKKSFFLKEGQSAGGVLLKAIEGENVTVIYKGEELNLTL